LPSNFFRTLGKLRIQKKSKKTEIQIIGTTSNPYTSLYQFSLLFWIKFTCFVNGEIRTCNLSHAYPPIPLHYYTNYIYITFSFLVYYNKPRVIWLFKTLNEFIWKMWPTIKLHNFLRSTNSILIVSTSEVVYKIWILNLKTSHEFLMIRWFQIKKLSITKFHYISRPTTFILMVFTSELVWKIQISKSKHNFAWQDDFKPKHCQLQNFITLQYLQLSCWWFFLSRPFLKFKF
jgi:hypothetical protein